MKRPPYPGGRFRDWGQIANRRRSATVARPIAVAMTTARDCDGNDLQAPTALIDSTDPVLPIERIDPTDPIEAIDPALPILAIEPALPIDAIEPAEPIEAIEPTEPIEATEVPFSFGTLWVLFITKS